MGGTARYSVGIDLGTTNSALACADLTADDATGIELVAIPQLVNPGEIASRSLLPSFLYVSGEFDFPADSLRLPWPDDEGATMVVGELARKRGSENPSRLVASAKSWLSYARANRTMPILPWGAPDEVPKLSPVAASARYLRHLRRAWDARFAAREDKMKTPDHVSHQVESRRIDVLVLSNRDRFAFPPREDRLERHVSFEHAAATRVNVTRRGADLRVRVAAKVLVHEVDEPALALQERKHLNRAVQTLVGDERRHHLLGMNRAKRGGQLSFEQNVEERSKRELDPSPHPIHGLLRSLIVTWMPRSKLSVSNRSAIIARQSQA